jgi:hypothetical protein
VEGCCVGRLVYYNTSILELPFCHVSLKFPRFECFMVGSLVVLAIAWKTNMVKLEEPGRIEKVFEE